MKAEEKGGSGFNIESGIYPAICVGLIDIGTQHGQYNGKPNQKHQIIIKWELIEEKYEDKDGVERRKSFSQFYTLSLDKKATLRKHLIGWRGQEFTIDELKGFEMKNVLEKPCVLTIGLTESGKSKVDAVSRYKGTKVEPEHKTEYFSLDDFDGRFPDWMGDGLIALISKSDEIQSYSDIPARKEAEQHSPAQDFDDDIPF